MAGLIKEILLDYGLNRLAIEQRNDITTAIESLRQSSVLQDSDLVILDAYISGFTAEEIAERSQHTSEYVEQVLIRIMQAIEFASGYTDTSFIRRIEQVTTYPKTRMTEFSIYLRQYGKTFQEHEPHYTKGI